MGGTTAVPRPNVWHILLLLPLVAVAVWVAGRARVTRDDPADVLKHLRTQEAPTLPEAGAAGALERAAIERYDRESLYQYNDGAAEAFIQRGFERCTVTTYTVAGAARRKLEIAAEAYRFGSPEGARQQLDADRPAAARAAPGLPEASTDGTTLLLVSGRDLLKLTSLGRGVDASAPLLAIASAWKKDQPR